FSSSLFSIPIIFFLFLFNAPPPTLIYTLSLHDALPISDAAGCADLLVLPGLGAGAGLAGSFAAGSLSAAGAPRCKAGAAQCPAGDRKSTRLNSSHRTISYAVFCLKKKNNMKENHSSEII